MNFKFSLECSLSLSLPLLCFMKRSDKEAVTFTSPCKQQSLDKSKVSGNFLAEYVTLGKLLNPMPQFLYIANGDDNTTYFIGLFQGFSELYVNCLE